MRFFNTAGPIKQKKHYSLDPLGRIDLEELMSLIHQEKYFVLHAPRQTGKTSLLLDLMRRLNDEGQFRCLYVNVEMGQAARENVGSAMESILYQLEFHAQEFLDDDFFQEFNAKMLSRKPHLLHQALSAWTKVNKKPTVLLIDEIDALVGDTLISVLRQLRSGYAHRPGSFPQSIVLCGVRDVRDYRIHASSEKDPITGGSAFQIKAKSLRLGNFSESETYVLLQQPTTHP